MQLSPNMRMYRSYVVVKTWKIIQHVPVTEDYIVTADSIESTIVNDKELKPNH